MKPLIPVMAALLAAASAPFALPRAARAADAPDCAEILKADSSDPRVILQCLIQNNRAAANQSIAARASEFVGPYLGAGLDDKTKAGLKAEVDAWPATQEPGALAVVYYAMGSGAAAPAWAQDAALTDRWQKSGAALNGRLAQALDGKGWRGKIKTPDDLAAFLAEATTWAEKILQDDRSKDDLTRDVKANDEPIIPPMTGLPRTPPVSPPGAHFEFDDLYRNGAAVDDVSVPDGTRSLSAKIYTVKEADGTLVNELGIVDITDPSAPSLPVFIALNATQSEFVFPGKSRHYKFSAAGGVFTISGEGGQAALQGDVADLLSDRVAQIKDSCARFGTATLGGKAYCVLGQGGAHGSFLFFAQSDLDNDPRSLHPALMGDVTVARSDDSAASLGGKPDLGAVDGKPYHLEMVDGVWLVKDGPGDKPGAKPDDKDSPGGPASPDAKPSADFQTEIDGQKSGDGGWEECGGSNCDNNFDPAVQAKVHILANKNGSFLVLFDKKALDLHMGEKNANGRVFSADQNIAKVRGFKTYVVVEYKTSVVYVAYDHFDRFDDDAAKMQFANDGLVNVGDVEVAADMLTKYAQPTLGDADVQKIRDRVAKHVKSGFDYVLTSEENQSTHKPGVRMGFKNDQESWWVWPNESRAAAPDIPDAGHGPGILSAPDAADDTTGRHFVATYPGGLNLYDDGKDPKTWCVTLVYEEAQQGAPAASRTSSCVPVFGPGLPVKVRPSGCSSETNPDPNACDMGGIEHVEPAFGADEPPSQPLLSNGGTSEKGAYLVYRGGQRDDKHCVAVVARWGMSAKEAAGLCPAAATQLGVKPFSLFDWSTWSWPKLW